MSSMIQPPIVYLPALHPSPSAPKEYLSRHGPSSHRKHTRDRSWQCPHIQISQPRPSQKKKITLPLQNIPPSSEDYPRQNHNTMAASPVLQSTLQQDTQTQAHDEYEILSDEQIQSLLLEAETRLRGNGNGTAEDSDKQVMSLEPVSESYTGPK